MGCSHQAPQSMSILQARILEWVAMPSSRGSSQPKDQTQIFCIADGFSTIWATREVWEYWSGKPIPSPGELPNLGIELEVSCIAGGFFTSWITREACYLFRIWNSSTGIPSPLLALFVVMLPKAHLTSHSRMSGSRWVRKPRGLLCHVKWQSFLVV